MSASSIATCGNTALEVVCGVLEALWTAHVDRLARDTGSLGSYANLAARKASAREHERIYSAIAKGDASAAERAARAHTGDANRGGWQLDLTQPVDAALLFGGPR